MIKEFQKMSILNTLIESATELNEASLIFYESKTFLNVPQIFFKINIILRKENEKPNVIAKSVNCIMSCLCVFDAF